jgi:hypothetical protein
MVSHEISLRQALMTFQISQIALILQTHAILVLFEKLSHAKKNFKNKNI